MAPDLAARSVAGPGPGGGAGTRRTAGAYPAFTPYPGRVSDVTADQGGSADQRIPGTGGVSGLPGAPGLPGGLPGADGGLAGVPHGTDRGPDIAGGAIGGLPGDEPDGGVLSRPYRALTFGIVSVVLMIAFEATATSTAMPVAARDLHGLGLYAFAFSGYFTTSLLAMVVSGQWCDRGGPLAPLGGGIAAFAAGLVISGTAGSMEPFVLGRAVQGFGGGLVIVALYVVVGRAYPERLRPSVMAAFSASWVVPSITGPLIAGTVTEQLGWRWVFLAIPVLVVLPLAVMLPALRRGERASVPHGDGPGAGSGSAPGRRGPGSASGGRASGSAPGRKEPAGARDEVGVTGGRRIWYAVALSAGAALLQYAGQDLRPLSAVPAVAGAALLVPAALRLLPRGTFRAARGLPAVVLMRGIAAGTFMAAESFIPLMLVTQRGLSPTLAGLSLAGGGLGWAAGSYVQSRPRYEPVRERLVRIGMLCSSVAIAGVALALDHSVPPAVVALAWLVGGFGMGLAISSLSVLLLKVSPPEDQGVNSAALQVSDALSNVLLVAAAGTVFSALGGGSVAPSAAGAVAATTSHPAAFAAVFLPAGALALAGAAVASRLRRTR
jgi:MFS family permease